MAPTLPHDGAFRDCPQCPRMVVIPAGAYEMGSPSGAGARDEERRHRVTIPQPLAVGMFEVQRGEFTRFMEETERSRGECVLAVRRRRDEGGQRTDGPGIRSGRERADGLRELDGREGVRGLAVEEDTKEVPTVERVGVGIRGAWQNRHAALLGQRAQSGQCGNANGADEALKSLYTDWFDLTAPCDDGAVHTSEAGRYGPNEFGLYDMLGNAREWVEDCWHRDYGDAPADGSAWTDGGDCALRVLRGGSWLDGPGGVRSSTRDRGTTSIRFSANGFRVARALD